MDNWKYDYYRQRGIAHKSNNTECQDYVCVVENEKYLVASLADGLGSLSNSALCAESAVKSICNAVLNTPSTVNLKSKEGLEAYKSYLYKSAVDSVKQNAVYSDADISQMDCTLCYVIILKEDNKAIIGYIGDSAIAVVDKNNSFVINGGGRSANGTATLLDKNAFSNLIQNYYDISDADVLGFMLTSDGLDGNIYSKGSQIIHKNAENYFNSLLSDELHSDSLQNIIENLTNNHPYFDDDISIAVISRADEPVTLDDDPTWLCTCGYRNQLINTYCANCNSDFVKIYESVNFKSKNRFEFFKDINKNPEEELKLIKDIQSSKRKQKSTLNELKLKSKIEPLKNFFVKNKKFFYITLILAVSIALISVFSTNLVKRTRKYYTAPNCIDMSIDEAKKVLKKYGVSEEQIKIIYSDSTKDKKDLVINQKPDNGEKIPKDADFNLIIGNGSVVDKLAAELEASLITFKFNQEKIEIFEGEARDISYEVTPKNTPIIFSPENYEYVYVKDNKIIGESASDRPVNVSAHDANGNFLGSFLVVVRPSPTIKSEKDKDNKKTTEPESTKKLEATAISKIENVSSETSAVTMASSSIKEVKVTFVSENGLMEKPAYSYMVGRPYDHFPTVTPIQGKKFVGWFTEKIGGKQITPTTIVDENYLTLYAHWETNGVTTSVSVSSSKASVENTQPSTSASILVSVSNNETKNSNTEPSSLEKETDKSVAPINSKDSQEVKAVE